MRPSILGVDAGDDLHEGRLAGPVLADEAVDLAGAQHEVDVAKAATPPKDFEMPVISRRGERSEIIASIGSVS